MQVRSFRLSDCMEVEQLFEHVLSEICYEETMGVFARQLSMDSNLVLVAVEKESIVGAILGTIDNNNAYYYRIAVDHRYRRRGIGNTLIEGLKAIFLQRNVDLIFVTVDDHNEPILSVYESLGYQAKEFSHSVQNLKIVSV